MSKFHLSITQKHEEIQTIVSPTISDKSTTFTSTLHRHTTTVIYRTTPPKHSRTTKVLQSGNSSSGSGRIAHHWSLTSDGGRPERGERGHSCLLLLLREEGRGLASEVIIRHLHLQQLRVVVSSGDRAVIQSCNEGIAFARNYGSSIDIQREKATLDEKNQFKVERRKSLWQFWSQYAL